MTKFVYTKPVKEIKPGMFKGRYACGHTGEFKARNHFQASAILLNNCERCEDMKAKVLNPGRKKKSAKDKMAYVRSFKKKAAKRNVSKKISYTLRSKNKNKEMQKRFGSYSEMKKAHSNISGIIFAITDLHKGKKIDVEFSSIDLKWLNYILKKI